MRAASAGFVHPAGVDALEAFVAPYFDMLLPVWNDRTYQIANYLVTGLYPAPLASVELRDQRRLATVLRGTDVRAIIAGHLHYSTFATFAGIPVSVASSTCYAQDLTVPVGGTRPQDGAQSYNLIHVFDDTVVHSVVPIDAPRVMEYTDAATARRRLADAGVQITDTPDGPEWSIAAKDVEK